MVFEVIVLVMEVIIVNDNQNAHNIIFLTSKATWGQRLLCKIHGCRSKIRPMTKWPLSSLKCQNVIAIWYFNENELTRDFRGHIDLKQPRNYKLKSAWARAISTEFHLNRLVDFISGLTFWNRTYFESPENFRSYDISHDYVASL